MLAGLLGWRTLPAGQRRSALQSERATKPLLSGGPEPTIKAPAGAPLLPPPRTPMRFATCLVLAAISLASRSAFAVDGQSELTYEQHIRPILKAHCFQCHGEGGQLKGGLDLRLKRLMETGGESGPAILAGKPDESLLVQKV